MKLRAVVTVDVNVKDFYQGAELQKHLEAFTKAVEKEFGATTKFELRERRDVKGKPSSAGRGIPGRKARNAPVAAASE